MPLPTTDAIPFRGIPSLGDKVTIALSLTLTHKQVEALFARQASINKLASQSATQFPLEIDFDKKKMYIGDVATSFNSGKETGIREICRRTPSSAKPLVGLFLSATVVGKLAIPRGLNDAASDLRKATEAEQTKKSERGIVRIDAPILAPNVKKPLKQTMVNRVVSSQPNPSASRNIGSASIGPSFPRPSASTPILPSIKEPDFNTLKSRLIHFIAAAARPKEAAVSEFLSSRPSDDEREVKKVFDQVAHEIPGPRNSDSTRWLWDLKPESWLDVRPFAFPEYTADQRTQASRRARISSGISSQHPVWEHFSTRVDSSSLATAKAITAGIGGGIYPGAGNKKSNAKILKMKASSTSKLNNDGDLKPRKLFPSPNVEETKVKVKHEPPATNSPVAQSSSKPTRKVEEDIILKPRAPSTSTSIGTKEEPPSKPPAVVDGSLRKRKKRDMNLEPASDMEEGELPSKEPKKRKITGPIELPKPEVSKKPDASMVMKKPPTDRDVSRITSPKQSRDSQGTNTTAGMPSSRISVGKGVRLELDVKPSKDKDKEPKELKLDKARVRERNGERERERDKGKEKAREKEDGREREKERRPADKDSIRGKERRIRDRVDKETIERVNEKTLAPIKHKRRPTPSFSSDSSEENDEPPPSKRVNTASAVRSSVTPATTTSSKPNPPKASKPSSTLPNDKEGLRREYGVYYAQYLRINSKFYEQKSMIENLLALDADGASADEGSDVMDSHELTELCNEYRRIRKEMEIIRKALNNINVY